MDETKKPTKKPFFDALAALMDSYDIVDYAFVAKCVDGMTRSNWIAGTGDGIIADRTRAGDLYFEMAHLQASIIRMTLPK